MMCWLMRSAASCRLDGSKWCARGDRSGSRYAINAAVSSSAVLACAVPSLTALHSCRSQLRAPLTSFRWINSTICWETTSTTAREGGCSVRTLGKCWLMISIASGIRPEQMARRMLCLTTTVCLSFLSACSATARPDSVLAPTPPSPSPTPTALCSSSSIEHARLLLPAPAAAAGAAAAGAADGWCASSGCLRLSLGVSSCMPVSVSICLEGPLASREGPEGGKGEGEGASCIVTSVSAELLVRSNARSVLWKPACRRYDRTRSWSILVDTCSRDMILRSS
mmetsp:Transcript_42177/g.105317  ORF Transcript_42177/g.105317 Transcript_42177/m.105317 type:complete len:281 (+) Transcript_42177:402-1244(+)